MTTCITVSSALAVVAGNTQASFVTLGSDTRAQRSRLTFSANRAERAGQQCHCRSKTFLDRTSNGALSNSGIDLFLAEVSDQNKSLAQKINAAASTPRMPASLHCRPRPTCSRRKIYAYSIYAQS